MVKVKINDKEYYFDGLYAKNLEDMKAAIAKNWDGVAYFCGYEGDGKTTMAAQTCYYMDSSFNLDRCVFTPEQFINAVNNAKKGQAIQFDEAHAAFDAKSWRDSAQRALVSMMTRIRKLNLFIVIVAPTFFDISKYIIIHRSRFMVHISARGLERGYWALYNRAKKHQLFVLGKKTENMYAVRPNCYGRFTNWNPLNEKDYEAKKDEAEQELLKKTKGKTLGQLRKDDWIGWLVIMLKEQTGWFDAKIARELTKVSEHPAVQQRVSELYGHIVEVNRHTETSIN